MGAITITSSGFSALPVSAPSNWPADLVWPAGGAPNGSRQVTISDTDFISLLTWIATAENAALVALSTATAAPYTITAGQVLVSWPNNWLRGTKIAVQQFQTTAPVVPPQITIA